MECRKYGADFGNADIQDTVFSPSRPGTVETWVVVWRECGTRRDDRCRENSLEEDEKRNDEEEIEELSKGDYTRDRQ